MAVTLFFNGSFYANLIKLDAIYKLINYEALLYGVSKKLSNKNK